METNPSTLITDLPEDIKKHIPYLAHETVTILVQWAEKNSAPPPTIDRETAIIIAVYLLTFDQDYDPHLPQDEAPKVERFKHALAYCVKEDKTFTPQLIHLLNHNLTPIAQKAQEFLSHQYQLPRLVPDLGDSKLFEHLTSYRKNAQKHNQHPKTTPVITSKYGFIKWPNLLGQAHLIASPAHAQRLINEHLNKRLRDTPYSELSGEYRVAVADIYAKQEFGN